MGYKRANEVYSARIKADRARQVLDWRPEFGEKDFEQEVKDVFVIMNQA